MKQENPWDDAIARLTSFNRILRAMSSSVYVETGFQRMSDEMQNLLPHDRASIAFASPSGDFAVVYASTGPENGLGAGTRIPLANSNVGAVIKAGAPLVKTDLQEEEDFTEETKLLAMGIRSNITVPVQQGELCSASLNFGSFQVGKYGKSDMKRAQEIADQIGETIVASRDVADQLNHFALLRSSLEGLVHMTGRSSVQTALAMGAQVQEHPGLVIERITPRETDVLRLMAHGESNVQIARELDLSEITIKKHVQSIMGKLGVSSRVQAAILAVRVGLAGW